MDPESENAQSSHPERQILIVDDDTDFCETLVDVLRLCSYDSVVAQTATEACHLAQEAEAPDVALVDVRLALAARGTMGLLSELQQARPGILCIMMTAQPTAETAIEALKQGAYDYLNKPFNMGDLFIILERAFGKVKLEREKASVEEALKAQKAELEDFSARLRGVIDSATRLAACAHLSEVKSLILREFAGNLGAEGGSLYLRQNGHLALAGTLDPGHAPQTVPFPPEHNSLFERAMRLRQPLLIRDIAKEVSVRPSGWRGYTSGTALLFPLVDHEGQVSGIVSLHNRSHTPFTQQDRDLGAILASHSSETLRAAQATENLRRSEERFRAIFETAEDAIFIKDLEGRYVQINPAMLHIVNLPAEQLIGRTDLEVFSPELGQHAAQTDARVAAGDVVEEELVTELGGMRRFIHVVKVPMREPGGDEILGILAVARDITQRKHLEEQLRQSQKMEALGQLAGGVAHDFNNLLQTVIAHVQFVEETLSPEDSAYEDIQQIRVATQKGAMLTRQLLAFSRRQHIEPEDLDLNRVIADLMKMVRRVIGEDVELKILPGENLANVHADPGQMEQILMNLAVNSRDAMPKGGSITIETGNRHLTAEFCKVHQWAREGNFVALTFSDTGCGMDEETRLRIFEPFFTTKAPSKGTGLGLATVYGIVKQHDGLIQVSSEVGVGTRFDIYLPVCPPQEAPSRGRRVVTTPRGTETVLLAEDDEIVRRLIVRVLKRSGYTVLVAEDGQQALDILEEKADEVAIAVLDVVMPKVSGRVVYERILEIAPSMPVLFCSGYSTDSLHTEFIAEQGLQVMPKPYNPDDLLIKMREMLDK